MSDWLQNLLNLFGTGATTAAVLAIIGYLLRDVLFGYIAEKVAFKNRSQITQMEDRLSRERQKISDLRQIVISKASFRNERLIEKQIAAAEDLWKATLHNKRHALAAQFLRSIKVEEMDKHITSGRVEEFVDATTRISGVQKLLDDAAQGKQDSVQAERNARLSQPFVSPLAWALHSAHSSIIWHAVMTMVSWKNGMTTKMLRKQELVEAVKLEIGRAHV